MRLVVGDRTVYDAVQLASLLQAIGAAVSLDQT
jgi:hypothetical protein